MNLSSRPPKQCVCLRPACLRLLLPLVTSKSLPTCHNLQSSHQRVRRTSLRSWIQITVETQTPALAFQPIGSQFSDAAIRGQREIRQTEDEGLLRSFQILQENRLLDNLRDGKCRHRRSPEYLERDQELLYVLNRDSRRIFPNRPSRHQIPAYSLQKQGAKVSSQIYLVLEEQTLSVPHSLYLIFIPHFVKR